MNEYILIAIVAGLVYAGAYLVGRKIRLEVAKGYDNIVNVLTSEAVMRKMELRDGDTLFITGDFSKQQWDRLISGMKQLNVKVSVISLPEDSKVSVVTKV